MWFGTTTRDKNMITRVVGRCHSLILRRCLRGQPINRTEEVETSPPDPFACGSVSRKKDISGEYLMPEEEQKQSVDFWTSLKTAANRKDNEETLETIAVGSVRRDSENMPRYHGQYAVTNTRLSVNDKKYSQLVSARSSAKQTEDSPEEKSESDENNELLAEETVEEIVVEDVDLFFPNRTAFNPSVKMEIGKFEFKVHDEWFDREPYKPNGVTDAQTSSLPFGSDDKGEPDMTIIAGLQLAKTSPLRSVQEIDEEIAAIAKETAEKTAAQNEQEEEEESESSKASESEEGPENEEEEETPQMTAFEYVKKLRAGELEPESESLKTAFNAMNCNALDSQGFNSFKGYVPDLTQFRRSELIWNLKKSIIFCDCDVLAINKPYGLIVQGKEKAEDTHAPVLSELLEDFSNLLLKEKIISEPKKLHFVHRLDKETTGVLVLAMSKEKATHIKKLFEDREITKIYHTITRSIPDPMAGIIDIPVEEGMVNGKERMVLRPELREEYRRIASPRQMARKAVTEYKVLSYKSNAAFVEVKPVTGVKHQIRVHLGFGMRCPILGDHKYTYLDRIAPQKLPADFLTALSVRPSKVRNIPIHLCSKVMILPGTGSEGRTIYLRAHTPDFFKKTMKRLKLSGG